ncbi:MAG: 4-vinyl reductase [Robinsoniella sp.]|nr:4-vinyl reductase [Robinsoniella sp.]
MEKNVFLEERKELELSDYMHFQSGDRGNLGGQVPVMIYRFLGILRIEKFDRETGKMILTISEDVDCSGLPMLGETVCNYDEGILSGILTSYTKKDYNAIEIDCWATGDRVCRFQAETKETAGE